MSFPLVEFGEVCRLVRGPFGGSLKKSIFVNDGYAVYEQQHAINNQFNEIRYFIDDNKFKELARFELLPNDLIMSCSGTMGKISIAPVGIKKGIINQALLKLTPNENIDGHYLKWLITSSYFQDKLNEFSGGAAIQNVASVSILKKIQIPVPSLSIQQEIVAKIDEIFSEIDGAKAATEANVKNAEVLFNSCLAKVFSSLQLEGKKVKLNEISTITSSKRIMKHEYVASGIPFYRTKEIKQLANKRDISTELFIDKTNYSEIKKKFGAPKRGDILLTAIGTIGEVYVIDNDAEFYFKDGNVLWIKNLLGVDPEFLKFILMSFVDELNDMSNGAAYSALPIHKLKSHEVVIPAKEIQSKIINKLNSIQLESLRLAESYKLKLLSFTFLKQSILERAFNGELVKD